MNVSRLLAILGFIIIGVASRLLPHPPNFTSINAIALFGILYLENWKLSLATVLLTMFLSDIILGFHSTMPFIYLSFSLIILIGYRFKKKISLQRIPVVYLVTSLFFFVVTNFGVWMTNSLYPKTINGLGFCYLAAIPFFMNQILGDLTYATLLFGYIYFVKNFLLKIGQLVKT